MNTRHLFSGIGRIAVLSLAIGLAGCVSKSPAPVVERGAAGGTATLAQANTYTVKAGDTLYSIARDHGMDFRELIALNSIENPDQIAVGRVLRIKSPTAAPGTDAAVVTAPITGDTVAARPLGEAPTVPGSSVGAASGNMKREPKAGKEPYSEQALAAAQGPARPVEAAPAAVPAEKPAETAPAVGGDELAWIWPANGKIVGTFSEGGSKGVDIAGKAGDPVLAAGEGKVVYSGTGLRGYGKLVIIKHNATYLSAYAHNQAILVKEGQSVSKGQKIADMGNSDADQVKLHFEIRRQGKPVDPLKYLPPR